MNDTKLRNTVTRAVALDREIAELTEGLKAIKADLVAEARIRREDHTKTEGGGSSWTAEGNDGCIARVTFPARKLKSSIPGEGKTLVKIRKLSGAAFPHIFRQVPAYKPVDDFRAAAEITLGKNAKKLIRAVETESKPTVSFETKENA